MAKVFHDWSPSGDELGLWQKAGPMTWHWKRGDGQHYWAFSIRPKRVWSSGEVEVLRQWTTMTDREGQTEWFYVDVRGGAGCDLMFNVIRVEEA